MVLQRWDPLFDFRRAMNRHARATGLVHPGHARSDSAQLENEKRDWAIPLDVLEQEDELLVKASIPGVKVDDIDVSIENHVLTIKAETRTDAEHKQAGYVVRERRSGSFLRSMRLPETVDADQAKTSYDDGVLTVSLPKAESKKAKHLKIDAGNAS